MALNKHKIILNDKVNLQTGLNEVLHEIEFLINQVQDEYNKLSDNTSLVDLPMEEKGEYAKAVHNFLTTKGNLLKLKLDVHKVSAEIFKAGGDGTTALGNIKAAKSVTGIDIKSLQKVIQESNSNTGKTEEIIYNL